MKMITWTCHLILAGILLNGCSDRPDQQHILAAQAAASKINAIESAITQANDARQAITKADNTQRLAIQEARSKQAAVKQAIAMVTQQSKTLQLDADNKSQWASKIHDKSIISKKVLLQAAMAQANAKEQLMKKEKAVQLARIQYDKDLKDAQFAASVQREAEKTLKLVLDTEQLALASLHQMNAELGNSNQAITSIQLAKATSSDTTKFTAKATSSKKHRLKKIIKTASSTSTLIKASQQRGHHLAQKCQNCHNFKPNQKTKSGPNLFNVVNQQAGKSQHYKYSKALAQANFSWSKSNLEQWICHSGKSIKKLTGKRYAYTKMSSQRICGQDAKDIVAYLSTLQSRAAITSLSIGS